MNIDPQTGAQMLSAFLEPWHKAVADPDAAQEAVLHNLVSDYAKTKYGLQHGAENIDTLQDYQRAFPVSSYEDYKGLIDRVGRPKESRSSSP
jgi:hypothetical protein